ncbi:hypothetical protein CLAIMM_01216 [Cladophialophora immunda]|nr:hypothetical protein CLAIMM_01216 [Cladophialophora immunda]
MTPAVINGRGLPLKLHFAGVVFVVRAASTVQSQSQSQRSALLAAIQRRRGSKSRASAALQSDSTKRDNLSTWILFLGASNNRQKISVSALTRLHFAVQLPVENTR